MKSSLYRLILFIFVEFIVFLNKNSGKTDCPTGGANLKRKNVSEKFGKNPDDNAISLALSRFARSELPDFVSFRKSLHRKSDFLTSYNRRDKNVMFSLYSVRNDKDVHE